VLHDLGEDGTAEFMPILRPAPALAKAAKSGRRNFKSKNPRIRYEVDSATVIRLQENLGRTLVGIP